MELMNFYVYITFVVITAIVCMVAGMFVANKFGELKGFVIPAIPTISILVGVIWPLVYAMGVFTGVCYILAYLVKKVS